MSILQSLPFNQSESGPEYVDGIGNFCITIAGRTPSHSPLASLFFLDSHGQIPSIMRNPDYEPIKQSQIDWFTTLCQAERSAREQDGGSSHAHLSLVFQHIPLPEFGDRTLSIQSGRRREPAESPRQNSHFYDALVSEGVSAFGCGHDHANDFCALLPQRTENGVITDQPGPKPRPWLCYGGASGFGGYGSYGKTRFHRRMRVWQLDTDTGSLHTWKRVEYAENRVDEQVLVAHGTVVDDAKEEERARSCVLS